MKQQIRLTESQLTQLVEQCAEQLMKEGAFWDALKGGVQGLRDVNRANRADKRAAKDAQKTAVQTQKEFDSYMKQRVCVTCSVGNSLNNIGKPLNNHIFGL